MIVAVKGTSNTKCSHTLNASSPTVTIEGKKLGLSGDSSGGSATSSLQSTVTSDGKRVLLEGDPVGGHDDDPHTPQKLKTSPQQKVSIN